ncbi:helix-turn-helix transcriptional regulator [Parasphingopyxis algicola]|uniref:S24 family peptidase n=1 Tax=Parasphingopyxis algicola TaxID=2026624 RepID=UPI0015A0C2DA|nr:helix-turn-helix transcriptional regulator [Parasphingopyxis algicola]QLC26703.1 helix-turn-helix transcriptional regulator [Parasphingopyxis algicola]
MEQQNPRLVLERLARERGDDYTALSRLIGRNSAYIQQFIKRGTPRRLAEEDRRVLAEYFGVDERILGAPVDRKNPSVGGMTGGNMVAVSQYAVNASAGPGALAGEEEELSRIAFPERWLRRLAGGDPAKLSIITVSGDSMEPTLSDGDEILVSGEDGADRLRDGIYVLRVDNALMVKRIAMNPASRRFTIKSDNDGYPDWPDCDLDTLEVIGRVVWAGRRLA